MVSSLPPSTRPGRTATTNASFAFSSPQPSGALGGARIPVASRQMRARPGRAQTAWGATIGFAFRFVTIGSDSTPARHLSTSSFIVRCSQCWRYRISGCSMTPTAAMIPQARSNQRARAAQMQVESGRQQMVLTEL